MNIRDTYHRIRIKKRNEWKTAFRTRYNYFKYIIIPFGLANTPAIFQLYINRALVGLIDIYYIIYLDNILIYFINLTDHQRYVREVLERFRNFKLYLKLFKCEFFVDRVKFFDFVIIIRDIDMEGSRVKIIIANTKYYFPLVSLPNPYPVIDISNIQLRKYYYSLESIQRFFYKKK